MTVALISAESTELFVGPAEDPLQMVRVSYIGLIEPVTITITGRGIAGHIDLRTAPGSTLGTVEVPVQIQDRRPGKVRKATARVGKESLKFDFVDAEPGWTMFMVSHFHYDPVWWNTQAAYTSEWSEDPPGACRQTNGFELVRTHLEMARRDPVYKFVLAEVDYLKPYWDNFPEDREDLRRLIAEGRVEIMGGTYNEPNTNLTSAETSIRNFVHGIGFQRDVMGLAPDQAPATAWQLDVFGHDPQFPGMAADAGLTSSSWARGPFHQWGPMQDDGDPARMQFASEFEWIAPSGVGLLTHYMPAHYSAGWWMDSKPTLAEAQDETFKLFQGLKKVSSTRNVLLPVGTDYTPPNKWVTEIHRDWNARYTWPRFVCALPREFFAAVRADLAQRGEVPSPQTRDMNPIYTGKDVSFIDTKQANRDAEAAVLDAERFATFAALLTGARYPEAALAKAWVQLAYGAHHDAITGSESDQVYLDLLTSWRDAWEIGRTTRDNALHLLTKALAGGPIAVWNPLAHKRTDVVTVRLRVPVDAGVGVRDSEGVVHPALVEDNGYSVSFIARDVPSLGWRNYKLVKQKADAGWERVRGRQIAGESDRGALRLEVDPARGGAVVSMLHDGRELISAGRVANELAVYEEYPAHPKAGEGPWHLLPKGPVVTSSESGRAKVQAYRCPIGQRLVVRGEIDGLFRYTQVLTLWDGVHRLDCRTTIDGYSDRDRLIRLRWPTAVTGAMPISEVGDAVVGRGFGLLHEPGTAHSVDTAVHPWTLENPAFGWFGLSSAARIAIGSGPDGNCAAVHAVSVAEVVTPAGLAIGAESRRRPAASGSAGLAIGAGPRELMVALVRAGVTATCSSADKPRYGHLAVDSNLPDTRIALGGPDVNAFSKEVLAAAGPEYARELKRQLADGGQARLFIPADTPLADAWVPDADLRGVRALPVLIVAGTGTDGLEAGIAALAADLQDAQIEVAQRISVTADFESRTVALLNRGVPSFAVEPDGTLHTSLMRSCTGWPSGVWTTHEERNAPDGSNFQEQHWSHTFDYAVVADDGDWRSARIPAHSAEFSRPLLPVLGEARKPAAGGSLLRVQGDGDIHLEAVKPAGNPTPEGSSAPVSPQKVVLRLVEGYGQDAKVRLRSDIGKVRPLSKADLLEQPRSHRKPGGSVRLHPYEIASVLAELDMPRRTDGRTPVLHSETEVAQPLYARYWLHNRGPAPLGGLPAAAHLHPHQVSSASGAAVLELTVASDCTDQSLSGTVEFVAPPGWSMHPDVPASVTLSAKRRKTSPGAMSFTVEPGSHRKANLIVTPPAGVQPGCYPIRAQLTLHGKGKQRIPKAWRQTVEDVCLIMVGASGGEVLTLVEPPTDVVLKAGRTGRISVVVGTDAGADLAVEAHILSAWGTWDWIGPAAVGAQLSAGGTRLLEFDVAPPPGTAPGQWWALVRVAAGGHLLYSPSVQVVVT